VKATKSKITNLRTVVVSRLGTIRGGFFFYCWVLYFTEHLAADKSRVKAEAVVLDKS
jgi:hypothetical protein